MANLNSAVRWERWVPNVGDNRKLKPYEQLSFLIAVGISTTESLSLLAGLDLEQSQPVPGETPEQRAERVAAREAKTLDQLAVSLGRFAKLTGTHTIDGKTITNLREYMGAVPIEVAFDVVRVIKYWNTMQGADELFFARSSGVSPTTDDPAGQ
jgi:hypothetical protein